MINFFYLSFKLIRKNILNTVYNITISFFVGLILLFLTSISISVKVNCDKIAENKFDSFGDIYLESQTFSYEGNNIKYISDSDKKEILIRLSNNNHFENVYLSTMFKTENYFSIYDIKSINDTSQIKLKNGLIKKGNNYIYISEEKANELGLNIGDTYLDTRIVNKQEYRYEFIVADIFTSDVIINDMILDYSFLDNKLSNDYIDNIESSSLYAKLIRTNDIKNDINNIKEALNYIRSVNNGQLLGGSKAYDVYEKVIFIGNLFFYLTLAFVVIILLLFFTLVRGMIKILIDKRKRNYGLHKALGMKNSKILSMMYFELFISLFTGILMSTIVFYALSNVFSIILNDTIISLLLGVQEGLEYGYKIIFISDFYIPLAVFVIILLSVIVFSYSSLRKILFKCPVALMEMEDI